MLECLSREIRLEAAQKAVDSKLYNEMFDEAKKFPLFKNHSINSYTCANENSRMIYDIRFLNKQRLDKDDRA